MINCWDTVEPWSLLLQKAMPMQSGAFFRTGDLVTDVDRNGVSPISFNGGPGEGSVDKKGTLIYSIGGNYSSSNVEIVSGPTSCKDLQLLPYLSSAS